MVPVRPDGENTGSYSNQQILEKKKNLNSLTSPFPPLQCIAMMFLGSAAIHSLTLAVYFSMSLIKTDSFSRPNLK